MRSKRRRIENKKQLFFRRGLLIIGFRAIPRGRRDWDDVGIVPYELHAVKFCVFTDSRKGCPYDLPPEK